MGDEVWRLSKYSADAVTVKVPYKRDAPRGIIKSGIKTVTEYSLHP
ncbi:MAG: hypothetical protein IJS61_10525 [Firmicutes bacterium]|nr:hypothetical protein [Bacillota bacterium]